MDIDPQHAGGPIYDWFETRARDIFANATGDVATVLRAVSRYYATYGDFGGQALWAAAPQSPIIINPFSNSVRVNGSSPGFCGQSSTHTFTDILLHEARDAYQAAQYAIAGNDVDGDSVVRNPMPVGPFTIVQDTTAVRTVCNEFSGPSGETFDVAYQGDEMYDPHNQTYPAPTGDRSAKSDYATEMDAHTFAGNHN
jgi:hypothetical protein